MIMASAGPLASDPGRHAVKTRRTRSCLRSDTALLGALDRIASSKGGAQVDRPRFHPFPARMPVWLAQKIIESLTAKADVVLDPMVGSGSTATAALLAGRRMIGIDVDPMSLLLSRAATTVHDRDTAVTRLEQILVRAEQRIARGLRVASVRSLFDEEGQEFLRYWFPPRSQKQLFALAAEIAETPAGKYRDLAWVVLSSLIIAKSAGVSYALDISRSRPHKVADKLIPNVVEAWRRRSKTVLDRLPFIEIRPRTSAQIAMGDARSLSLDSASVDLVLTSPPYLNAIDYMRTHKFSLIWMGHGLADLREIRSGMIGTERGMYSPDSLPRKLEGTIVDAIDDASRLAQVRRYLSDMRRVLIEFCRVLKRGGAAVIALGPQLISREDMDAGTVIGQLAESVGLQNVGWSFRALDSGRRSLPPPNVVGNNNSLRLRMEGEVFLALRKP